MRLCISLCLKGKDKPLTEHGVKMVKTRRSNAIVGERDGLFSCCLTTGKLLEAIMCARSRRVVQMVTFHVVETTKPQWPLQTWASETRGERSTKEVSVRMHCNAEI